jgi:hypothetical protein
LVWLVLPAVLLPALPALLGLMIGRSFTFWQLCLSMPDVMILLGVAALTGVVLAAARLAAASRKEAARLSGRDPASGAGGEHPSAS